MNRKVFVLLETLLLVIFITATIILAQKLTFDPQKGFMTTAGIKIDGVKHASVEVGNEKRSDTPVTVDYLSQNQYQVKVSKNDRKDWKDLISVIPQYITRIYPILFPSTIKPSVKIEQVVNVYATQSQNTFFYTKLNSLKRLEIHKYSITQNLFGDSLDDRKIFEFNLNDSIDKLAILPSFTGQRIAININSNIYIVSTDSLVSTLGSPANLPPTLDNLKWSLNERFLIYSGDNIIYSYDISNQQRYVVAQNDVNTVYKFMDVDSNKLLIFKTDKLAKTYSLFQINIDGNNLQKLNIPQDLTNLQSAYIYPSGVGLILQIKDTLIKVNPDDLTMSPIIGTNVILIDHTNNLVVTQNGNKMELYDVALETSQIINLDPTPISNLSVFFKNSNLTYNQSFGKSNTLSTSYVTGGNQTILDSGTITPLISWKRFDYVRIFYAKQQIDGKWIVNSIEFEN